MERFRHRTSVEQKVQHENPFIQFFIEHEQSGDSAYLAAIDTLGELRKTASSIEEFQEIILEDVIFTSLSATYYEHLFNSLRENPEYLIELIDRFSEDTDSRDNEIAQQGNDHFNYILSGGICPGCKSCAHHHDVDELLAYWQKGDLDFFITLYIGMQTIQYALDQVLYDLLPNDRSLVVYLTSESILEFRQFVYKYSENKINS
jgi:hypothetical protein